jgi:hypothetical protein
MSATGDGGLEMKCIGEPMRLLFIPLLAFSLMVFGCTTIDNYLQIKSYERTLMNASSVDTTNTDVRATRDSSGRQALLLSAFFGLDDALPDLADYGVCPGAGGADGMPVIFSHEIDVTTMQAGDFRVTTASGKTGDIICVTLAPADDRGELRTALLAGHYGSIDDQPVRVEIVGNLLSIDKTVNFKGASIAVTPLADGPVLVLAEIVPKNQWKVGEKASAIPWGGGSGCPAGTVQALRVVWAGGVTKPGGAEIDDNERWQYRVIVAQADGTTVEVTPFAIADLGDGDNNHLLCLDVKGVAQSVSFPAGFLTDPRDDVNPATTIRVTAQ